METALSLKKGNQMVLPSLNHHLESIASICRKIEIHYPPPPPQHCQNWGVGTCPGQYGSSEQHESLATSAARVSRRWGLLSHWRKAVRSLAFSEQWSSTILKVMPLFVAVLLWQKFSVISYLSCWDNQEIGTVMSLLASHTHCWC